MNKLNGIYLMGRENEYKLGIETDDGTPEITILKTDSIETIVGKLMFLITGLNQKIIKGE